MGLCHSKVADESSKFFLNQEEMKEREERQRQSRIALADVRGVLSFSHTNLSPHTQTNKHTHTH
jgi:hypothetical protein